MSDQTTAPPLRGRGSALKPDSRFLEWQREHFDDGWDDAPEERPAPPATTLTEDRARSVITFNKSPDLPFDRSINPYRGCEHGCSYCFARPSHAYLGFSPGLDFETRLVWKPDAAARLREELARPSYRCAPIALGVNTDAWQPVERKLGVTRAILEVLVETRHPVSIVTKGVLIERDLDLLADLARDGLAQVMISITTLDRTLARRMEPRAPTPERRLEMLRRLDQAKVPVGVLMAPLIPALNDHELEQVLEAASAAGASMAGYVLLRLPHELRQLFTDWLDSHYPQRAARVLNRLRELRGGGLNNTSFGTRMRGEGVFAELYAQRLAKTARRLGLNRMRRELDCSRFVPPRAASPQMDLF